MTDENVYQAPNTRGRPLTPPRRGPTEPPGVVTWFKIYAGFMAVLYVLCFFAGVAMLFVPEEALQGDEDLPPVLLMIYAVVFIVLGIVLAAAFVVALFAPRKKWAWILDVVLIGLGMTSFCCLPASVPLLIYWIKPETKAYFNFN